MSAPIETAVEPAPDELDDGDQTSTRIGCHVIDAGDTSFDAGLQLFDSATPEQVADGLLRVALAVAQLLGPDHWWAAVQRFRDYDGTRS